MTLAPVPHLAAAALASQIATNLDAALPPRFSVHAEGTSITVLREGNPIGVSHAAAIVESVAATTVPDQHAEAAIRAALRGVQEYLAKATGQPWPATDGALPRAGTRRTGDTVEMWFGDEGNPVLQPRPVDLYAARR
jgi:hypothetical protein